MNDAGRHFHSVPRRVGLVVGMVAILAAVLAGWGFASVSAVGMTAPQKAADKVQHLLVVRQFFNRKHQPTGYVLYAGRRLRSRRLFGPYRGLTAGAVSANGHYLSYVDDAACSGW